MATAVQTQEHLDALKVSPEISLEREANLRRLLDEPYGFNHGNYDFARDSGLIDMFYYDPATGQDGLVHVLSGNVVSTDHGKVVEGFHHEPSGFYAPEDQAPSTVELAHLEGLNAKERAEYKRTPFDPYKAKALVAGAMKTSVHVDTTTGMSKLVETKNSMFPNEYDALAVMQTIRIAYETRDTTKDQTKENVIVTEGTAPMIDGKTPMRVRLILDKVTEKIITATPIVRPGSQMKLTPEEVQQYVYGNAGLTTKVT